MAINELHKVYPNRNSELRAIVKQMYEFGYTIAQEPSAAHSSGMDEHAIGRQRRYLEYANSMVDALSERPIPDLPISHNPLKPIDLSVEYVYFTQDLNGNHVPLNEYTQLLAEAWLMCAVELAASQSASIAGSIVEFDYERAKNNLATIEKLLDEIETRPTLDLPETALPGAALQARSGGKK